MFYSYQRWPSSWLIKLISQDNDRQLDQKTVRLCGHCSTASVVATLLISSYWIKTMQKRYLLLSAGALKSQTESFNDAYVPSKLPCRQTNSFQVEILSLCWPEPLPSTFTGGALTRRQLLIIRQSIKYQPSTIDSVVLYRHWRRHWGPTPLPDWLISASLLFSFVRLVRFIVWMGRLESCHC